MPAPLSSLHSIEDLRRRARRQLPRSVFEFIDGGAEDELTLADNRAAFERHRIVPRVLTDVSSPDLSTTMFDTRLTAPLVVAPMGSCMLAWPQADIAIARAAAAHGLPYTLSTMSTTGLERLARAVTGTLWFQLYVLKDPAFNRQLMQRAWDHGYRTLVVTVDLQTGGNRERDLRNGITLPMRLHGRHLLEGLTHPGWALRTLRAGRPEFENVRGYLGEQDTGMTIAARVGRTLDAAFNWESLQRLREHWPGKLMVKGVLHAGDAVRLVAVGVDGLWVSNHGGRQLDGAVASADALPAIARAVHGRVPLVIDSGVRRGVDLLKARALGASAAATGRAVLFGAAVAGEAGAHHALGILVGELARAMKLAGVPAVDGVDTALVTRPADVHLPST